MPDGIELLELADWRREVSAMYARVRTAADPSRAREAWRLGRDHLFQTHSQSPLAPDDPFRTVGVPYWPYDPSVRWTLEVTPTETPRDYRLGTGGDQVTVLRQTGWITLPEPYAARLAVWSLDQYGGGIFLPIRDATAGQSTYGGGRYLLDTAKGADLGGSASELVIDLNFLYHPSCRYDSSWICPLAPVENVLGVGVLAGERLAPE